MLYGSCGVEISEDEIHVYEGKGMCEDCVLKKDLFPLGHIGLRRDKISEKGRCLCVPEPNER